MRAVAHLDRMRRRAESLMTDTCQITIVDPDAAPVWNPATGSYDTPTRILYGPGIEPHQGKCRLKAPALVNAFEAGGSVESWQVEQSVLSLPAEAPPIPAGAVVTYLTSTYNPGLPGRIFGVVGPHHESAATAQRLAVKEVVGTGGG